MPTPSVLSVKPLVPPVICTLATAPNDTLPALTRLRTPPLPSDILTAPILAPTIKLDNVPTLVIFGCALVDRVPMK